MVNCFCHISQQRRIAICVASHQAANLCPLRERSHRREQRPALEVISLRIAVEREKVIPVPDSIDAQVLNTAHCISKVLIGSMLGMNLYSYSDWVRIFCC